MENRREDLVYRLTKKYLSLLDRDVEYNFYFDRKLKINHIRLTFIETDFRHILGVQHMKDLQGLRMSSHALLNTIKKQMVKGYVPSPGELMINEAYISRSCMYNRVTREELNAINSTISNPDDKFKMCDSNMKSRIQTAANMEKFLDNRDSKIAIFENYRHESGIDADYIITSKLNNIEAYIFIRKRTESDSYVVVSVIKHESRNYSGDHIYIQQETKISNGVKTVIQGNESKKKKKTL